MSHKHMEWPAASTAALATALKNSIAIVDFTPLAHDDHALTPSEVALEFDISEASLRRMRRSGEGPTFDHFDRRAGESVFYWRGDVKAWLVKARGVAA